MSLPPQRKRRLGELLQEAGLIDEVQLAAALAEQRKWGGKLGRTLVEMGFVTEEAMAQALSAQLGLPRVDLDTFALPADALEFLRVDIAERYGVFPLGGDRKQKTVTLATADPTNVEQLQELSFYTGMRVVLAVSSPSAIDRAIRRHYYGESTVSSQVTTPRQLGVTEPEYDLSAQAGRAKPVSASLDAAGLAAQLEATQRRLAELERIVAGQGRALRGMLELLLEAGVIDRDLYLARVRREDG